MRILYLLVSLVLWIGSFSQEKLWYQQPAEVWEQALPLGNGRIGAMIFGRTDQERIQLNDDSMWPGDPGWGNPDGTPADLDHIRELLIAGRNELADSLLVAAFSRKDVLRSHQTLGDLWIDFDHEPVSTYRRSLTLDSALARVSFQTPQGRVASTAFCSTPDQVLVVQYTTTAADGLSGSIRMNRPEDEDYPTAFSYATHDHILVCEGEVTQRAAVFDSKPAPILSGVKFQTILEVRHEGGSVYQRDSTLVFDDIQEMTLLVTSQSSFYHQDYQTKNTQILKAIEGVSYQQLLDRHLADYQSLYDRVQLSLGGEDPDSLPTDERLARVKSGSVDLGLESLLFQYGRYLLISSSRPGTNPANLQGLWNQHIAAPWNADYHLNINLQMNYWPAHPTGLPELAMPLFDYTDRLIENGKVTARDNFGCRGSFIPHATDLWAPTWLRAATAYWGASVGAAGWLMQHYWEHFNYTQDTMFLRSRAFPALEQVAQFYADWIITDPRDGYLVSAPSTSPENRFYLREDLPVATCMGSAMDQQVIDEVFSHYIQACRILDLSTPLLQEIRRKKEKLRPGMIIGADGRILEWDREYAEFEKGHRHMSHLYAFHPGTDITLQDDPELFAAVRKTLDYRLEHGGAGTGWSRAWLINCSARLLDGSMAHEHIQLLLQKSLYDNLFDGHPPFQIDGNFGYTAGLAEMLVQSHENQVIHLLPALPDAWQSGMVKGLIARGDHRVNMSWSNGVLTQATLTSGIDGLVTVRYDGQELTRVLHRGDVWEPSFRP